MEAMGRLRDKFLSVPLDAVLHPVSLFAQRAATDQSAAAHAAPPVQEKELTAQQWFEQGFAAFDVHEKLRFYTEAIRLKPDYAKAFNNRGKTRSDKGDVEGAEQDYTEAIRFKPNYAIAYYNRGLARRTKGDVEGAWQDRKGGHPARTQIQQHPIDIPRPDSLRYIMAMLNPELAQIALRSLQSLPRGYQR